jgi:hypothetical protein
MSEKVLVCAGGGSLGVSQVRTLMTLRSQGKLNFTRIKGTSTGNLTAVCLGFAIDLSHGLDNLISLYKGLKGTGDIFCGKASSGIPIISSILNFFTAAADELVTSWPGTISNSPLYKLLQKSIPHIAPCVEVESYVTSVVNGSKVVITAHTDGTFTKSVTFDALSDPIITIYGQDWFPTYLLFVLASTAFPPECDATTIENMGGYVDGGLCDMVPVDDALKNSSSITILLCGGSTPLGNYSGSRDGLQYGERSLAVVLYWQIQDHIDRLKDDCREANIPLTIYDLQPGLTFPASDQFVPSFISQVLSAPDAVPVYSL